MIAPSPSWILLSNQRLMVLCPQLYTGNPHILTSVCSNPELLQKEKDHLRKALTKCNYPKWALDKVEGRLNRSSRQVADGGTNNAQAANHEVKNKGHIVILHTRSL